MVFVDFGFFASDVVFGQSPRVGVEDVLLHVLSIENLGANEALLLGHFDPVTSLVMNGQRSFRRKHVAAL